MSLTKFTLSDCLVLILIISSTQARIFVNNINFVKEFDDSCLNLSSGWADFSGCGIIETIKLPSTPVSNYYQFNDAGGQPVLLTEQQPLLVEGGQQQNYYNGFLYTLNILIGQDTRSKVRDSTKTPYSSVGQIADDCTGAVIGSRHILTAAHCIDTIRYDVNWKFAPGKDSAQFIPFGEYEWVMAYVPDEYLSDARLGGRRFNHWQYDYSIVILRQQLHPQIVPFKFDFQCTTPPGIFAELNIIGYPCDKASGTMWKTGCSDLYMNCNWKHFQHTCDTKRCMSGSPMFAEIQQQDGTIDNVIYGVHIGKQKLGSKNSAVVMTEQVQAKIKQWLKLFSDNQDVISEAF